MENNAIENTNDLISYIRDGNKVKFLYFWGYKKKSNSISKECFSQWYEASFIHEGKEYKTAEHFMMVQKAKLFNDIERITPILNADNPGKAKSLGRSIQGFDQYKWDQNKINIVIQGNIEKFNQNPDLKEFLLNTKQRILVEASPIDKIWGTGLAADDPLIENPNNWLGSNLLGFVLMNVRKQLM